MSVNGASMIFGLASLVICVAIGSGHSLMWYWLAFYAKEGATRSLPHCECKHQQCINEFWFCKLGISEAIWSLLCIIKVLAAFIGERDRATFPAPW